jgi:hypothetical protein
MEVKLAVEDGASCEPEVEPQIFESNQRYAGSNPALTAKVSCEVCGKFFSRKGIGSHIWRVHGAGVGFKPVKPGTPSPRKGKTKETDESLRRQSLTLQEGLKSGRIKPWTRGIDKSDPRIRKTAAKISATVRKKCEEGTWHNSFSRSRTHLYKGHKLYGKWEVEFAKYLDGIGINWVRCSESFPYEFEGRIRRYTPDFYIPDSDLYIEVKGYRTAKDDAKWANFPKKLLVLRGEDLKSLGLQIQCKSCE